MAAAAVIASSTCLHAETLSSAVYRALSINPNVQAYTSETLAAEQSVRAAKGAQGPTLTATATAVAAFKRHGTSDQWRIGMSGSQSIFDGGYAKSELRRSKAQGRAADSRLYEQELITALETVQTYLEVQRTRGLMRILQAKLSSLEKLRLRVKRRVDAGIAHEAELFEASSKIDASRAAVLDAKNELAQAVVSYRALVGKVPGDLETVSTPSKALPRSESEAADLATASSPRIMAVTYDALAAEQSAKGFEAALAPKIDLGLEASHTDGFNDGLPASDDLSAQISFRFDLYDGGAARARAKQSHYQAEASRSRAKAEADEVRRQMKLVWNNVKIASERIGVLRNQLNNTRRAFELNLKRYQAGVTSLSQILDLHESVAATEAAWLNAEFAHRYNVYRLLAGTGRLPAALHLDSSELAAIQ